MNNMSSLFIIHQITMKLVERPYRVTRKYLKKLAKISCKVLKQIIHLQTEKKFF